MPSSDNYRTEKFIDYLHYQKYYKLICIDLPRQRNQNIPQQINFVRESEEHNGATMFSLLKSRKTLF